MIIQDGLRRMLAEQEDVFYYLTVMNENYAQPAMPEGARGGDRARDVPAAREHAASDKPRVQLLGCGTILREVLAAAELLESDYGRRGRRLERHELHRAARATGSSRALEPAAPDRGAAALVRRARARRAAAGRSSPRPTTCATFADQIRPFVPGAYTVLGTDGFGRSDYREKLRRFFEVDRHYVASRR